MTSVPSTLPSRPVSPRARSCRRAVVAGTSLAAVSTFGLLAGLTGTAQAAATPPGLGTAGGFAVLAGAGITNTGPSTITGDIGTFPTPSTTGFGPGSGTVVGTDHAGDAVTQGAKSDLLTAYGVAAGEGPPTAVPADLVGLSLTAGVYDTPSSMALSGQLTLDAAGDPDAVFVFQAGSTLVTASGSRVVLRNGAQACNVYWQVGSSATLGTTTDFRGNVLADTSITLDHGATVQGRVLASNGAVTLDDNVITRPACTTPVSTPVTTPVTPPVTTPVTPPVTTPVTPPVTTPVTPSATTPATPPATSPTAARTRATGRDSDSPTTGGGTGSTASGTTYGQVRQVPVGAVDTGDGSTAGAVPTGPPAAGTLRSAR